METEPTKSRTGLGRGYLVAIGLLVAFPVAVWIWSAMVGRAPGLDDLKGEARLRQRLALEREDRGRLDRYAWVDPAKGFVQVPVERAMELAVDELAGKQVKASDVKVDDPYPFGLPVMPAPDAAGAPDPAKPEASP